MRVFVSHSSKDSSIIGKLREELVNAGFEPYIATEKKQPGRHLSRKIKEAIDSSDILLAVLSKNSESSAWVHQEIGYAEDKVFVIPLVQTGVELPALLQGREYLTLDITHIEKGLEEAVNRLREFRPDIQGRKAITKRLTSEEKWKEKPRLRTRWRKFLVDDIFLIHRNGRLIAHYMRELSPYIDADILAGMLTAMQDIIEDSIAREEELRSLEFKFQEKKVLVERGKYVHLAVFTTGEVPADAGDQLRIFVEDVEEAYADVIPQWKGGDIEVFKGLEDLMDMVLVGRGYKKGYWKNLKLFGTKP